MVTGSTKSRARVRGKDKPVRARRPSINVAAASKWMRNALWSEVKAMQMRARDLADVCTAELERRAREELTKSQELLFKKQQERLFRGG